MIKQLTLDKINEVMKIWLETNIDAHYFVDKNYWISNYDMVKEILPEADVYIFEEDNIIKGFVGVVQDGYIAGLFVKKEYQGQGVGNELIGFCKSKYSNLTLDVFIKNKKALDFYRKNNFVIYHKKVNEDTGEMEYSMFFSYAN